MRRYTLKCEAKQKAGPAGHPDRGAFWKPLGSRKPWKNMKKTDEVLGIFEDLGDFST